MGSLDELRNALVFIDTAPLIYLVERNAQYVDLLRPFFAALGRGEVEGITSAITLTEVVVQPLRHANKQLADEYKAILTNAKGVAVVPVTPEIAEAAAEIRAKHNVKSPDAIQVATAIVHRARFFLTNDLRVPQVTGLHRVLLDDVIKAT